MEQLEIKQQQKPLFYLDKKQQEKIKAESYIVLEYPTMKIITANRHKNQA